MLTRALAQTLPELANHFAHIYVFRQPPEIPYYDSRETARRLAHHRITAEAAPITADLTQIQPRSAHAEALFAPYIASDALQQIDPWPQLCTNGSCSVQQGSDIWYFDNNHLNNTAARALTPLFAPVFERTQ